MNPSTDRSPVSLTSALTRHGRRLLGTSEFWSVVAGLVVGVVLVASAWPAGTVVRTSSDTRVGAAASGEYFSAASSDAVAWSSSFQGGGWRVIGAQGYAVPLALVPRPVNSSAFFLISSGGSCSYNSLVPLGKTFQISATTGSGASGQASFWRIDLVNSTSGVLSVLEIGGQVQPLAVGTCSGNFSAIFQPLPSQLLNSTGAAQAAWVVGGDDFVAQFGGSTTEFALSAGASYPGPSQPAEWFVQWVDCSNSTMGQGVPGFSATVDAATGSVLQSATLSEDCPFSWVSG